MLILELPDALKETLPDRNASIWDILHCELPPIADEPADSPFVPSAALDSSSDIPSTEYLQFTIQPTAPDRYLNGLQALLSQPGGDQHKSINIPWFPKELGCVGLWIIEYWEQIGYLRWVQDLWKPRLAWLTEHRAADVALPNALGVYDEAIECLRYISVDEKLPFRNIPRGGDDLEGLAARLLSGRWLSNWIITHLMDVLYFRVAANHPSNKPIPYILPPSIQTSFMGASESAKISERVYEPPKVGRRLEAWMEEEDGRYLLFTLNLNNVHWVAGCADLLDQTVQIGDSYGGACDIYDALEPLQVWFHHVFGQRFPVKFNLPTGKQEDGSSCGLFAVNTLAMCALGDAPLTHQARNQARVSGFVETIKLHLVANKRPNNLSPPTMLPGSQIGGSGADSIVDISDDSDVEGSTDHMHDYRSDAYETESAGEQKSESEGEIGSNLEGKHGFETGDLTKSDIYHGPAGGSAGASTESLVDLNTRLRLSDKDDAMFPAEEPNPVARKRKSMPVDEEIKSESSSTESRDESKPASKQTKKRTKRKKSTVYDRETKQKLNDGTFRTDKDKWDDFVAKIQLLDPKAAFDEENPRRVRHTSKCGKWITMELPYQIKAFKDHCATDCKRKPAKSAGTPLLQQFAGFTRIRSGKFATGQPAIKPEKPPPVLKTSACGGLKDRHFSGIDGYIARTSYSGGGSFSVSHYARTMFGVEFRELKTDQKEKVATQSYQDQRWRIAYIEKSVYSTKCLNTVEHIAAESCPPPCPNCLTLRSDHGFKKSIKLSSKKSENLKYTNHRFLNMSSAFAVARTKGVEELLHGDDKRTIAARFAARIVLNPQSDQKVFSGLISAAVMRFSKKARGVGLQNSTYSPEWDDFCFTILAYSPSAYHTFRSHLPARLPESFRSKRSRDPKFPLSIDDTIATPAKSYLENLNYKGPVCLACDDTKLLPSLQTYYDTTTRKWMLVGCIDGAREIADNEALIKLLQSKTVEKAPKLRLWTLQVPLPGIAPLAIAALPMAASASAPILAEYLKRILNSLFDAGIEVVSYASDGSIVEQNVQTLIFESSSRYQDYWISCGPEEHSEIRPSASSDSHKLFRLGFFRGHALVMIQDSKHALKTCRNNLFSGARLLVIGNHVLHYSQVHKIAFDPTSTLFHRDVEKLDRQDDQAASRLFCAATLEFILLHQTECLGLAVYLFVMGELCDAYQSRSIGHAERFKMLMRAYYFLLFWKKFLSESKYPMSQYFISHQASSILSTVIEGLVLLMIVYRDHLKDTHPLFPWLHSTEPCEHMFGELRKLIKDFTYRDVIFAMAKLRVILQTSYQAGRRRNPSTSSGSDSKKATGYQHTCIDGTSIDFSLFCDIPSPFEMSKLAYVGRTEAANLLQALGVQVPDIPGLSEDTPASPEESDVDPDIEAGHEWAVEETEHVTELEALQEYFCAAESSSLPPDVVSRHRDNVVFATSALGVEQFHMIERLPDESTDNILADRTLLYDFFAQLPHMHIPDIDEALFEPNCAPSVVLDFEALVAHRRDHQTAQAYRSPKNFRRLAGDKSAEQSDKPRDTNQHAELARIFAQTLKSDEHDRLSDRVIRWTNAQDFGIKLTGNAANAKQAADSRARVYVSARRKSLERNGVLTLLEDLATARITLTSLDVNDFVWVICDGRVELGQVRCIYGKEGGAHGAHFHLPRATHIGQISYIGVQIFEHIRTTSNRFRAMRKTSTQESLRFQHTSANNLLMAIRGPSVIKVSTGNFYELPLAHTSDFQILTKNLNRIKAGLSSLTKFVRRGT